MIFNKFKQFRMGFNYKLAEEIISCFNEEDPSEIIDNLTCLECLDSDGVIQSLFQENLDAVRKPEKYTLLHSFCEQYLYYYLMHERWFLVDELCDDFEVELIIEHIGRTANILKEYGISCRNYSNEIYLLNEKYEATNYSSDFDYKSSIGDIFDDILAKFDDIEETIIEATFYLLYDNKEFLFKFNRYISTFVTKGYLPESCFDDNKHIIRAVYIPEWLKRAVFYRDRGRCQHCGKDLSGQMAILDDRELQYDHIIPLESGGTNDSTNFQLLCDECNQKKSGQLYFPNYFYQMYW